MWYANRRKYDFEFLYLTIKTKNILDVIVFDKLKIGPGLCSDKMHYENKDSFFVIITIF